MRGACDTNESTSLQGRSVDCFCHPAIDAHKYQQTTIAGMRLKHRTSCLLLVSSSRLLPQFAGDHGLNDFKVVPPDTTKLLTSSFEKLSVSDPKFEASYVGLREMKEAQVKIRRKILASHPPPSKLSTPTVQSPALLRVKTFMFDIGTSPQEEESSVMPLKKNRQVYIAAVQKNQVPVLDSWIPGTYGHQLRARVSTFPCGPDGWGKLDAISGDLKQRISKSINFHSVFDDERSPRRPLHSSSDCDIHQEPSQVTYCFTVVQRDEIRYLSRIVKVLHFTHKMTHGASAASVECRRSLYTNPMGVHVQLPSVYLSNYTFHPIKRPHDLDLSSSHLRGVCRSPVVRSSNHFMGVTSSCWDEPMHKMTLTVTNPLDTKIRFKITKLYMSVFEKSVMLADKAKLRVALDSITLHESVTDNIYSLPPSSHTEIRIAFRCDAALQMHEEVDLPSVALQFHGIRIAMYGEKERSSSHAPTVLNLLMVPMKPGTVIKQHSRQNDVIFHIPDLVDNEFDEKLYLIVPRPKDPIIEDSAWNITNLTTYPQLVPNSSMLTPNMFSRPHQTEKVVFRIPPTRSCGTRTTARKKRLCHPLYAVAGTEKISYLDYIIPDEMWNNRNENIDTYQLRFHVAPGPFSNTDLRDKINRTMAPSSSRENPSSYLFTSRKSKPKMIDGIYSDVFTSGKSLDVVVENELKSHLHETVRWGIRPDGEEDSTEYLSSSSLPLIAKSPRSGQKLTVGIAIVGNSLHLHDLMLELTISGIENQRGGSDGSFCPALYHRYSSFHEIKLISGAVTELSHCRVHLGPIDLATSVIAAYLASPSSKDADPSNAETSSTSPRKGTPVKRHRRTSKSAAIRMFTQASKLLLQPKSSTTSGSGMSFESGSKMDAETYFMSTVQCVKYFTGLKTHLTLDSEDVQFDCRIKNYNSQDVILLHGSDEKGNPHEWGEALLDVHPSSTMKSSIELLPISEAQREDEAQNSSHNQSYTARSLSHIRQGSHSMRTRISKGISLYLSPFNISHNSSPGRSPPFDQSPRYRQRPAMEDFYFDDLSSSFCREVPQTDESDEFFWSKSSSIHTPFNYVNFGLVPDRLCESGNFEEFIDSSTFPLKNPILYEHRSSCSSLRLSASHCMNTRSCYRPDDSEMLGREKTSIIWSPVGILGPRASSKQSDDGGPNRVDLTIMTQRLVTVNQITSAALQSMYPLWGSKTAADAFSLPLLTTPRLKSMSIIELMTSNATMNSFDNFIRIVSHDQMSNMLRWSPGRYSTTFGTLGAVAEVHQRTPQTSPSGIPIPGPQSSNLAPVMPFVGSAHSCAVTSTSDFSGRGVSSDDRELPCLMDESGVELLRKIMASPIWMEVKIGPVECPQKKKSKKSVFNKHPPSNNVPPAKDHVANRDRLTRQNTVEDELADHSLGTGHKRGSFLAQTMDELMLSTKDNSSSFDVLGEERRLPSSKVDKRKAISIRNLGSVLTKQKKQRMSSIDMFHNETSERSITAVSSAESISERTPEVRNEIVSLRPGDVQVLSILGHTLSSSIDPNHIRPTQLFSNMVLLNEINRKKMSAVTELLAYDDHLQDQWKISFKCRLIPKVMATEIQESQEIGEPNLTPCKNLMVTPKSSVVITHDFNQMMDIRGLLEEYANDKLRTTDQSSDSPPTVKDSPTLRYLPLFDHKVMLSALNRSPRCDTDVTGGIILCTVWYELTCTIDVPFHLNDKVQLLDKGVRKYFLKEVPPSFSSNTADVSSNGSVVKEPVTQIVMECHRGAILHKYMIPFTIEDS
eukprot:GHVH01003245.1.p1 GENE.GHVH01003245.1~~GHVH01003245.1.p1  ORF type:complete len:1767 (+),score=223.94 GHVH01003245.1:1379-6679(+)